MKDTDTKVATISSSFCVNCATKSDCCYLNCRNVKAIRTANK